MDERLEELARQTYQAANEAILYSPRIRELLGEIRKETGCEGIVMEIHIELKKVVRSQQPAGDSQRTSQEITEVDRGFLQSLHITLPEGESDGQR